MILFHFSWRIFNSTKEPYLIKKTFFINLSLRSMRARGHWTVYYTSTQSFQMTFSYSLPIKLLGLWLNFDKFCVQMFQPLQTGLFCLSSFGMYINLLAIVLSLNIRGKIFWNISYLFPCFLL